MDYFNSTLTYMLLACASEVNGRSVWPLACPPGSPVRVGLAEQSQMCQAGGHLGGLVWLPLGAALLFHPAML